jgi:hypothetical protein
VRRLAAAAATLLLAAAGGPARAEAPRVDYMLHCQGCHLADGSGSPGAVPTLRDQIGNFLRVPGGREYLVRVPGSAQSSLDDAALADLLNWMVREFGPAQVAAAFAPYTAPEVGTLRYPPLADVETRRAELLDAISRWQVSSAE